MSPALTKHVERIMILKPPILRLRNVGVRFGEVEAVRDVTLDLAPGEFLSLLGPSGCGKSTLLRAIAGYVVPSVGQIHLNGIDVTAAAPQVRRIGMVFQNYALFPHMTVGDNIAFGLRRQGKTRAEVTERVAAMLVLVRLDGFAARRPAELSGGQQQRVALARALAFRPQLLLLDEPLAALDLHLRDLMQVEIKRVQQETGVSTIFVTHDQGEALGLSDRVAVMNIGRIEQVDTPRALYRAPQSAFVASFVGRSNLLPVEVVLVKEDAVCLRLAESLTEMPISQSGVRPAPGQRYRLCDPAGTHRNPRTTNRTPLAVDRHGGACRVSGYAPEHRCLHGCRRACGARNWRVSGG